MAYSSVFGGGPILPSDVTYLQIALTGDIQLAWPMEAPPTGQVVARIMDVTAAAGGFSIAMPPADEAGHSEVLFFNVGSNQFEVTDVGGNTILVIDPGDAWVLYVRDNSTANGTWGFFQAGAGSSSAQASALAGAGLTAIGSVLAQEYDSVDISVTPTNLTSASRAVLQRWTGGAGTFTFDPATTLGMGWFCDVRNDGGGSLVLDPNGGELINGATSITLQPSDSCRVFCNGVQFYTVGLGQSATFAFDFVQISVAGSGTLVLAGSQLNRIAYRFTGLLTGDRTIEVPATIQQYWVDNSTTGAFNLYVKTNAQTPPGVQVVQGARAILYCDGTNVLDADTSTLATPIPIAQGGTGATTASGARTNLGATATGDALFTAASAAAARATLGAPGLADANVFTNVPQTVTSATVADPALELISTDAGAAAGPTLSLYRDSASPAANDVIGALRFYGEDGAGNKQQYASIFTQITDQTSTSEDARLGINTIIAGAAADRLVVGAGLMVGTPTPADLGNGTINMVSAAAGTLLQLESTDAGAGVGPQITLYRNSASPAASDAIGSISFDGEDSVGNTQNYAQVLAQILDATSGSEDAVLNFLTVVAGAAGTRLAVGQGLALNGATDLGVGTINMTSNTVGIKAQLVSTDAGAAVGPQLSLFRDSASPANSDVLGGITFEGRDGGAAQQTYAQIQATIVDVTGGNEDASLDFLTANAGAVAVRMRLQEGLALNGAADIGPGTIALLSSSLAQNMLTIENTDATASPGPVLGLYRNSASPAANDDIGVLRFNGKDSAGNLQTYNNIYGRILDPTNGSEDSQVRVSTTLAGTLLDKLILGAGLQLGAPTGGDQGTGSINLAALPFINGVEVGKVNVQVFTANGTYTPTTGMRYIIVVGYGGGGAGGGAPATGASQSSLGSSGNAGAKAVSLLTASQIVTNATVTIGAGGTGVSGTVGNSGGATTFVSNAVTLLSAAGGEGGLSDGPLSSTTNYALIGQTPSQSAVGNVYRGWTITSAALSVAVSFYYPAGAPSNDLGGGARSPGGASSVTGVVGLNAQANTGGGASGAANGASQASRAGGTGGSGYLYVIEFF